VPLIFADHNAYRRRKEEAAERHGREMSLPGVTFPSQSITTLWSVLITVKGKGKIFPYSLPSVGPGPDLGVQAVSPQVT